MSTLSDEQQKHNESLWKYFPLGQIDAIWAAVESLANSVGREKYYKEIDAILGAIQNLDNLVREERFPLTRKKTKHVRVARPKKR